MTSADTLSDNKQPPTSAGQSFGARLRDELLNGEVFYSLRGSQILIERWRRHCTTKQLNGALGYRPPSPEFIVAMEQRTNMHQLSNRSIQVGLISLACVQFGSSGHAKMKAALDADGAMIYRLFQIQIITLQKAANNTRRSSRPKTRRLKKPSPAPTSPPGMARIIAGPKRS